MIAEPNSFPRPEPPENKLTGRLKKTALAAAAVELVIFWVLVIRYPEVMAPLSVLLALAAWYFRRTAGQNGSLRDELKFSANDLELVDKYCKSWIYIAAYGAAFAVFLILKG